MIPKFYWFYTSEVHFPLLQSPVALQGSCPPCSDSGSRLILSYLRVLTEGLSIATAERRAWSGFSQLPTRCNVTCFTLLSTWFLLIWQRVGSVALTHTRRNNRCTPIRSIDVLLQWIAWAHSPRKCWVPFPPAVQHNWISSVQKEH